MRSLWVDPGNGAFAPLDGDLRVDLAIVGGGFSGLGAAWAAGRLGASTVVLEERCIAAGASGRNAGFILAGPAMPFDIAVESVGSDNASGVWRLTAENSRLLASLIDRESIECGYLRRGSMSLAATEAEWNAMRATLHSLRSAGIEACAVEAQQLPRPFDGLYAGGIYYAGNAEFDPGAFLCGVSIRLSNPVVIHERTPVLSISYDGARVLRTRSGDVTAGKVLLATNAYTRHFLPSMPIVPRRGQMLATARLPHVVAPFPMYADRGYQYWRQTPDGRLVIGGWRNLDPENEVGEEELLHPDIQAALSRFCLKVLGAEVKIEHRWAGIMGFTPDMFPLVGRVPRERELLIAAGYSGHGVSMAFTCGARAAALALNSDADIPSCFDPARFTT